jgi:hypothetical protein
MRADLPAKSVFSLCLSLPVLLLVLGVLSAFAADVIENVGEGRINWSQGLVTANGIGAPPKDLKNPAQIRAMTQRAAISVARRNLLEVLKGVQIDSETMVQNFIVSSDVIKTQVSGILQGSQVVQSKYFSDGSIEVTVGVYLQGDLASILMPPSLFPAVPAPPDSAGTTGKPLEKDELGPASASKEEASRPAKESPKELIPAASPATASRAEEGGKAGDLRKIEVSSGAGAKKREAGPGTGTETITQPAPEKALEATAASAAALRVSSSGSEVLKTQPSPTTERKEESVMATLPAASSPPAIVATGLVVDARGLGLKPALLPRILNEAGSEIYGTRKVSRQNAVEQGLVGYAKDIPAAQKNIRVTDKPLLVKGIKAAGKGKTDVVIPDADAAIIVASASGSNFLEKSRVIIVYD